MSEGKINMTKKIFTMALGVNLALSLYCVNTSAQAEENTVEVAAVVPSEDPAIKQEMPEDKNQAEIKIGTISVADPEALGHYHAIEIKIGKRTNSQVRMYRDQLLDKHVMAVDARFQAGGTEKIYVAYYVIFQNAAGNVIGASSGSDEIEPGTDYGWNSIAAIPLPEKRFDEIAYYQFVLYESDKPIGAVVKEKAEEKPEEKATPEATTAPKAQ